VEFVDEDLAQCLLGVKIDARWEPRGAYGFLGYEVVSEVCNSPNLHHVRVPDGLQATNE